MWEWYLRVLRKLDELSCEEDGVWFGMNNMWVVDKLSNFGVVSSVLFRTQMKLLMKIVALVAEWLLHLL